MKNLYKRFIIPLHEIDNEKICLFGSTYFARDIQHQVGVVNIEVPIREPLD